MSEEAVMVLLFKMIFQHSAGETWKSTNNALVRVASFLYQ